LEVAELPVETRHASTHIDFVLRTDKAMMVAECKRVDPAMSCWGFVRAPFTYATGRRDASRRPRVDRVAVDSSAGRSFATPGSISGKASFHIGKEIKTNLKGNGTSQGRKTIDDAINQIFRARSGFMEYLGTHLGVLPANTPTVIVLVVFTSARLVTSDIDLGTAKIEDGKLEKVITQMPKWIWFEYNVPWSMRPDVQVRVERPDSSLGRLLEVYHSRSVAIVTAEGVEEFLSASADAIESFVAS
jgi:hypothetical protein